MQWSTALLIIVTVASFAHAQISMAAAPVSFDFAGRSVIWAAHGLGAQIYECKPPPRAGNPTTGLRSKSPIARHKSLRYGEGLEWRHSLASSQMLTPYLRGCRAQVCMCMGHSSFSHTSKHARRSGCRCSQSSYRACSQAIFRFSRLVPFANLTVS